MFTNIEFVYWAVIQKRKQDEEPIEFAEETCDHVDATSDEKSKAKAIIEATMPDFREARPPNWIVRDVWIDDCEGEPRACAWVGPREDERHFEIWEVRAYLFEHNVAMRKDQYTFPGHVMIERDYK